MTEVLTVDPGLSGLGYARWNAKRSWYVCHDLKPRVWTLRDYGSITPRKTEDLELRIDDMILKLSQRINLVDTYRVYIERPQYFGSHVGETAARSDSLVKLAMSVGALVGYFYGRANIEFVSIGHWKGQLSKEVVWKRCLRARPELEELGITSHSQDAIGIGLWLQNELHKKQRKDRT